MKRGRWFLLPWSAWVAALGVWIAAEAPAQSTSPSLQRMPSRVEGSDLISLELDPLQAPLRFHGTGIARSRLFVIGGTTRTDGQETATQAVVSRVLALGGTTGATRSEVPLPESRTGISRSCGVWNQTTLLVAGGAMAADPKSPCSNVVWSGSLKGDDSLQTWKASKPWPGAGLRDVALAVNRTHLFVIGGMDAGGKAKDSVYQAPIEPDGTIGEWTVLPPLPETRVGHAAFCDQSRLYVVGGRREKGAAPRIAVYQLDLTGDASWVETQSYLPGAVADGAASMAGDHFFWFGGLDVENRPVASILMTRIRPEGLGLWRTLAISHGAVTDLSISVHPYGHYLYAVGGTRNTEPHASVSDVTVFALDPGGFSPEVFDRAAEHDSSPQVAESESSEPYVDPNYRNSNPLPQFLPENEAMEEAAREKLPLLVMVYSSKDSEMLKRRTTFFSSMAFRNLMTGFSLGEVDVESDPDTRSRYATESLPAFLVYNREGRLVRSDNQAKTLEDFAKLTFGLQ